MFIVSTRGELPPHLTPPFRKIYIFWNICFASRFIWCIDAPVCTGGFGSLFNYKYFTSSSENHLRLGGTFTSYFVANSLLSLSAKVKLVKPVNIYEFVLQANRYKLEISTIKIAAYMRLYVKNICRPVA